MWALVEDLNVFYIFPSLVRILAIDLRADGDIEVLRRKLRIPTSFYIPHTHRRVGWRSRSCRIGQIFKDWEHRFGVRITGFRLSPDPRCSQRFPSRLDPIIVLRAKAILKCTLTTIIMLPWLTSRLPFLGDRSPLERFSQSSEPVLTEIEETAF